jgi:hypothetical protein
LRNGSAALVLPGSIVASIGNPPTLGSDFTAAIAANGSNIVITVNSVKNVSLVNPVVGTWFNPPTF